MSIDSNAEKGRLPETGNQRAHNFVTRVGALGFVAGVALLLASKGEDSGAIASETPDNWNVPSASAPVLSGEESFTGIPEVLNTSLGDENGGVFEKVFANGSFENEPLVKEKVDFYKEAFTSEGDHIQMDYFLNGWGEHLENEATRKGLDADIVAGIIFIESRGDNEARSAVGALGVAQLMPETARRYGLVVDNETDERLNQYLSINAATSYFRDLKSVFGEDIGLATWAYHAGEGNVMKALRYYFLDTKGIDVGNYDSSFEMETDEMRLEIEAKTYELVQKYAVNVSDVLTNPSVKENVLDFLEDDTVNYAFKAVAAAQMFEEES